jgi:DNA-binding transcriptional regulator PaaX
MYIVYIKVATTYNIYMMKVVKETTRGDISRTILTSIKVAGFISAALVAPNVLTAFEKLGISIDNKSSINRARNHLLKEGYLKRNDEGFLSLSEKGEKKLEKLILSNYELRIPRIWDKKWRVIIFDIPEYRKNLRDKLRKTLINIGFCKIQNSVWVFPYDCEDLLILLKADFKIGRDVLYLVVDKLEGDEGFREVFGV